MAFTAVAWSESQDSATLVNMAALADQHVRIVGDDVVVPNFAANLAGYYFLGANFTQGQLSSPSLRRTFLIDVEPGDRTANVPQTPPAFHNRTISPVPLDVSEALNALMAEDAAGVGRVTAVALLSDGPIAPDVRPSYTIRATNTSTLVAFAWSNGALTFTQTLPAGRYAVTGARYQGATATAFRLVFVGASHRPGGLGAVSDLASDVAGQRYGGWGVWGEFEHDAPPTVDFLATGADASQIVHLDLVQTRAGAA